MVTGHFYDEVPMQTLSEERGVTESRISQLRDEALILLRDGLNAHLNPAQLAGAALVVAGVVLAQLAAARSRPAS